MNIDLSKYFDEHKPTITVFGKEYEVENDCKKVLAFFKLQDSAPDDEKGVKGILAAGLVDGEKAADEIMSHPMPFVFMTKIISAISVCVSGASSIEQLEANAKKAQFRK